MVPSRDHGINQRAKYTSTSMESKDPGGSTAAPPSLFLEFQDQHHIFRILNTLKNLFMKRGYEFMDGSRWMGELCNTERGFRSFLRVHSFKTPRCSSLQIRGVRSQEPERARTRTRMMDRLPIEAEDEWELEPEDKDFIRREPMLAARFLDTPLDKDAVEAVMEALDATKEEAGPLKQVRLLLIVNRVTPDGMSALAKCNAEHGNDVLEVFLMDSLLVDPTEHDDVPYMVAMHPAEARAFLKEHFAKPEILKRMIRGEVNQRIDPIVHFMGWGCGTIVRIYKSCLTAGVQKDFRIVFPMTS